MFKDFMQVLPRSVGVPYDTLQLNRFSIVWVTWSVTRQSKDRKRSLRSCLDVHVYQSGKCKTLAMLALTTVFSLTICEELGGRRQWIMKLKQSLIVIFHNRQDSEVYLREMKYLLSVLFYKSFFYKKMQSGSSLH